MSTGDGEGPGTDRSSDSGDEERRPTPPPARRTPPPRTRSDRPERPARDVEHRSTISRERAGGSVFGRIFGRQGLDDALEERFKPYDYLSTRPMLRWVFLALLLFIAAAAYAIWADYQFRSQVSEWSNEGLTAIPIDNEEISAATRVYAFIVEPDDTPESICAAEEDAVNATPTPNPEDPDSTPRPPIGTSTLHQACNAMERVFEHAVVAGIDCTNAEQFGTVVRGDPVEYPGCTQLFDLSKRYSSLETATIISTVLIIFALIVNAFTFSSFAHRASRNLRTLRSEGQKHSPDGLVIRFFIPGLNVYKPPSVACPYWKSMIMFVELFKGSDPRLPEAEHEAWKKKGAVSPVAVLWGIAWGAAVIFNPVTASALFFTRRDDLADIGSTFAGHIAADILLVVLGVLAILMSNTLAHWQDARAAKYGTVTVTPPRPRDPLEKALQEGVRRQDTNTEDNRERRSRRRKK